MPAFQRVDGAWVEMIPRTRDAGAWTTETAQLWARDGDAWHLIYPDPLESTSGILPVQNLAVTSGPTDSAVTVGWTNPTPLTIPTHVQIQVPEISSVWLEYDYPITAWTHSALQPGTPYQVDVRLVQRAFGIQVAESPNRSVFFTTTQNETPGPAVGPEVGGGNTTVTIPRYDPGAPNGLGAAGCTTQWTLYQSAVVPYVWSSIATGTSDTGSVDIVESTLTSGYWYRLCSQEKCSGVLQGTEVCQVPWLFVSCIGPDLGSAPYNDVSLAFYVPEICPPSRIYEAVSNTEGFIGPAFGTFIGVTGDTKAWIGSHETASGRVAHGFAAQLSAITSNRSIHLTHTPQNAGLVELEAAGIKLGAYDVGGGLIRHRAVLQLTNGTMTLIDPTAVPTTLSTYEVGAVYDSVLGTFDLYVDRVLVDSADVSLSTPQTPGIYWSLTLPADSWATDCAVWSSVIEFGFPNELIFEHIGNDQSFVVPVGITLIEAELYGAEGGTGLNPGAVGQGGFLRSRHLVTPGETIYVCVGGQNNAGNGSVYNWGAVSLSGSGGTGGGASDIRVTPFGFANRMAVAGGGGGYGRDGGAGGDGAGNGSGLDGASSGDAYGRGGTRIAGGAGGDGGAPIDGEAGTLGTGGYGHYHGAGGAGGIYGGGGAGGSPTGGGGGGSGGVLDGGIVMDSATGVRNGHGRVIIRY